MRADSRKPASPLDRAGEDRFEKAAREYRRAIDAADRLRRQRLVGMYRAEKSGGGIEGLRPTESEIEEAEKKIEQAFLALSRTI